MWQKPRDTSMGLSSGAWPGSSQIEHKLPPNCSKPGVENRKRGKESHVMHSKYLVKINEGATSAKNPFLAVHRGETVPSLALKRNFLL